MAIDTADLPQAVQRAVVSLDAGEPARDSAARLRNRAAHCWQSVGSLWPTEQWHQIHEQLALTAGYLTAATRIEEGSGT